MRKFYVAVRKMSIIILLFIVTRVLAQPCDYENSVELKNRTYNGIFYRDGEFYVDKATGMERGCVCMKEKCIRKCCPLGQGFDRVKKHCVDIDQAFDPPLWEGHQEKPGAHVGTGYHLVIGQNCSEGEFKLLWSKFTPEHHLETDGNYYLKWDEGYVVYGPDKYCIDNFSSNKNENKTTLIQLTTLLCYKSEKIDTTKYYISSVCMLISCFFMILTIAVYTLLPELRTLHGLVLVTYLVSFFVAFLFLAIMQLMLAADNIYSETCVIFTFIIYFGLLAAFFWLNVLCYNLWKKLRLHTQVSRKASRKQFLSYCAYAFGVPTILTAILALLEFGGFPQTIAYLPRIRLQGCFLYGFSKLLYLYVPIMIICAANLVLFILIARKIAEIRRRTQELRMKHTQRFSLYIELFIVTGISWVLEVISHFYPAVDYIWQFTDIYNSLVGLLIFIIFVCKKKVLVLIKIRFKQMMGHPVPRKPPTSTSSKSLSQSREEVPMNTQILFE